MGLDQGYQPLVVVYCSIEDQISRIMKRNGLTREQAELRIGSQLPTPKKLDYANFKIDTSKSKEETLATVTEIARLIRALDGIV
jgi:dephospho-CoA kinase